MVFNKQRTDERINEDEDIPNLDDVIPNIER